MQLLEFNSQIKESADYLISRQNPDNYGWGLNIEKGHQASSIVNTTEALFVINIAKLSVKNIEKTKIFLKNAIKKHPEERGNNLRFLVFGAWGLLESGLEPSNPFILDIAKKIEDRIIKGIGWSEPYDDKTVRLWPTFQSLLILSRIFGIEYITTKYHNCLMYLLSLGRNNNYKWGFTEGEKESLAATSYALYLLSMSYPHSPDAIQAHKSVVDMLINVMGNKQYLEVESIAGTDWHHYAYSWALKSLHLPSSPFDEETYKITSKVLEYIATLFCKGRGYIEPGKEICNVRSTFNNVLAIDAINKNFDASHYIFLNKLLNQKKNLSEPVKQNALVKVEQICSRFHLVVKQLMSYHSDKNSIIINDEYDTQNLLHSLLHIYFDDIRREEYTPSYVGGSARVDFLLKNESIFIEVKKTRKNLKAKQIRDELLVDIQQYQTHPDCKKLVCFIYDPERLIPNPLGIEKDLKHESKDFVVKVIIVPKEY